MKVGEAAMRSGLGWRGLITACRGDERPDCPILDDIASEARG